jgi:transcriptional regulator with XRE-family HTH domain
MGDTGMGDSTSPLMLRRRLRTELRTARLDSDLTQEQVARAMEWSMSKINRIEKAKSGISANDLKVLLPFLGIKDKKRTEELIELARAARESPWWSRYKDVAPEKLLELIDYESAASAVSQFEPMFVPGILQTEEFARAILQVFYDEKSAANRLAAMVDLRTKRRGLLTRENAPHFSFVLDESIIHRVVGSPAIMSRQFQHLASVAELPNVTIQVVPFTAGPHPGMKGPFAVVQFADTPEENPDENIVFLEGPHGDIISDDPKETENYLEAFNRITAASLSSSDSVERLLQAADEMT